MQSPLKKILLLCSFSMLFSMISNAQIKKAFENILQKDSQIVASPSPKEKDSRSNTVQADSIRYYQLREANLLLELEQLRSQNKQTDSLKRVRLQHQIDSLRLHTKGIPVVVEGDTLFTIYANRGGNTPLARARSTEAGITSLKHQLSLNPDSVYLDSSAIETDIMYKDKVIISVTDQDALWADMSRGGLARTWQKAVVSELKLLKKQYGISSIIRQLGLLLLILFLQGLFIFGCHKGFLFLKKRIQDVAEKRLKPIRLKNYELLNQQQEVYFLTLLTNLFRYVLILISLLISIPLIFSIFPSTEEIAHDIFHYLLTPVKKVIHDIIHYLPNLVIIFVIWLIIHYLVRSFRYIAEQIATGKLNFKGFYADWARPSFDIIRLLLYLFMIGMIYPYLPGSNLKIFQGISVFAGILVSFGSSSLIANLMAGLAIIYMRQYRIGDRIQIDNIIGDVIEKTTLVTRVRTPKNEIVTIPNSFILSKQVTNFSASATRFGLIIHTTVTIGYNTPWRQVNQLLINSALATEGIQKEPLPFVLELSLDDNYPVYQINAYITDAEKAEHIKSDLLQNIQDLFDKAGVEILSPSYIAMRNGNESTIPKEVQ